MSWFEISETVVKDSVIFIAYQWNRGVYNVRLLARGHDWNKFFKVCVVRVILLWGVSLSMFLFPSFPSLVCNLSQHRMFTL